MKFIVLARARILWGVGLTSLMNIESAYSKPQRVRDDDIIVNHLGDMA